MKSSFSHHRARKKRTCSLWGLRNESSVTRSWDREMGSSPRAEPLSCSYLPPGETEAQRTEGSELICPGSGGASGRKELAGKGALTCLGLLLCPRKRVTEELGLRPDEGQPRRGECGQLDQVSRSL